MPSADIVSLAILPAVFWAAVAYVRFSSSNTAAKLRVAHEAKTKQDLIEGSRLSALLLILVFSTTLAAVVVWTRIQGTNLFQSMLGAGPPARNLLHGMILGLSMLGLLLFLRAFFPQARAFGFVVTAGIATSWPERTLMLLLVVFTEELWRATALNTLVADKVGGPQALLAMTVAYGLAYLPWGNGGAWMQGVVGAAFGALFMWSGSFFVPLGAHLIIRGQQLLYWIAAKPDAGPGDFSGRPHTSCPACRAKLKLSQVNLNVNAAFFCPFCRVRITASDRRRAFTRWGFVLVSIPLLLATFDVFPGALHGNDRQYWLALVVACWAGLGVRSILNVVFPPKLECGDPDFVSLNLSDRDSKPPPPDETGPPTDQKPTDSSR
jgi:hypothetical protein